MEIKQDETGSKYFDEVPEGFREATYHDFFDDSGKPIINMPFLLELPPIKDRPVRYYAYRTQRFNLTLFEYLGFFKTYVPEEKSGEG